MHCGNWSTARLMHAPLTACLSVCKKMQFMCAN